MGQSDEKIFKMCVDKFVKCYDRGNKDPYAVLQNVYDELDAIDVMDALKPTAVRYQAHIKQYLKGMTPEQNRIDTLLFGSPES